MNDTHSDTANFLADCDMWWEWLHSAGADELDQFALDGNLPTRRQPSLATCSYSGLRLALLGEAGAEGFLTLPRPRL